MSVELLRVIVKVYPDGAVTTGCSDTDKSVSSESIRATYSSRGQLAGKLIELGSQEQANVLTHFPLVRGEITEIVLSVPNTSEFIEGLGFYGVGATV